MNLSVPGTSHVSILTMPFFKQLRDPEVQGTTKHKYMTSRNRLLSTRTVSCVHSSFQKLTGIPPSKLFHNKVPKQLRHACPPLPNPPPNTKKFFCGLTHPRW